MSGKDNDAVIDIEALQMSKFATPKLQWVEDAVGLVSDCFPSTSSPEKERPLSCFERLPLELRMEIYGYLGYPVDGNIWLEYCNGKACCEKGQYNYGCPKPCGFQPKLDRQEREARSRIYGIHFNEADVRLCLGHWIRYHPQFNIQSCRPGPVDGIWALHQVSKAIRTEILNLVFGRTYAVFDYELSSKTVHFNHWIPWGGFCDTPHVRKGGYSSMRLSTSLFSHLTRIHLRGTVGSGWTAQRPGVSPYNDNHRALVKQARSINFIANHCPALSSLVFEPDLPRVASYPRLRRLNRRTKIKQSCLDGLAAAISALARLCYHFETLHIPEDISESYRWLSAHTFLTYGKDIENVEWRTLSLAQVEYHLKEDMARAWAEQVVQELSILKTGASLET